jgi:hypothetical protein
VTDDQKDRHIRSPEEKIQEKDSITPEKTRVKEFNDCQEGTNDGDNLKERN